MANKYPLLSKNVDIVFKIEENEWNGQKSLQMKVIDVRASEWNAIRIFSFEVASKYYYMN